MANGSLLPATPTCTHKFSETEPKGRGNRLKNDIKECTHILRVLLVPFNVSVIAMPLCLLYIQALVAGATSNVVVVLVIGTAIVPGSLVYGVGKALNRYILRVKRIHVGDEVYLITTSATNKQLDQLDGPYTVEGHIGKGRYHIRNQRDESEGIATVNALLKKSELYVPPPEPPIQPQPPEFCTDDEVYYIATSATNQQLDQFVGPYTVIGNIGKGRYHIRSERDEGIASANVLLKKSESPEPPPQPEFGIDDEVYLITTSATNKQLDQLVGPYTVICYVGKGRYHIKDLKTMEEGIAKANVLLKRHDIV